MSRLITPIEWVGRVVDDRYEIVEKLGEGGMGAVYIAMHRKLQKRVAFKVMRPELANVEEIAARFTREAMAGAQIDHPHVAGALDYGTLPEGGGYFVMPLVQGENLQSLLERQDRLHWTRAAEIGAQIADALATAHSMGIVHRDLKPENVVVESKDDGTIFVTVLDFGIAAILAPDSDHAASDILPGTSLTRVGAILGTPGYMAPEQATGQPLDGRADLYALGVLLWEMTTGEELYGSGELLEIVTKQVTETPPPINEKLGSSSVPAEFQELVSSLLLKEQDRPPDAKNVRDQLKHLQRTAPVVSSGVGWKEPVMGALSAAIDTGVSMFPEDASFVSQIRRLTSLQRLWVVLGSFVCVGILVAALAWLLVPGVPRDVRARIDTMLHAPGSADRRQAARWLRKYKPKEEVPTYARFVADLELASRCRARLAAVDGIRETGDDRALPILVRIQNSPRRGCGFLKLSDCHDCVRPAVRKAIDELD